MSPRDVRAVDALRTPLGRRNGALAPVRPDGLASHGVRGLPAPAPGLDRPLIEDVHPGGAGEENRTVARRLARGGGGIGVAPLRTGVGRGLVLER